LSNKVIVVGAGLGGLSAAISLAEEGFDVEVFEKNDKIGGKLNIMEKDGFTFDLGPSILTMPEIFNNLFKKVGKDFRDYVPIKKLEHEWRSFFEDGTIIDLYNDLDEMGEKNNSLTKKDIQGLKEYLEYTKKIYNITEEGYFDKGLDTMSEILGHYGIFKSLFGLDYFKTMHQRVEKYLDNENLIHMMDFFIKYVGSSPYHAPAVLNLLFYVQNKFGLWYVEGGMYNIAEGLKKLMNELGIKVHLNSEVIKMNKTDGKIKSITLKNGEEHQADIFVSNMEVIPAYENLIEENSKMLDKYKEKFEPACSGLVLHLGVKKKYEMLNHHNFFFSKDPEHHFESVFKKYQLPSDPTIYLVASAKTDAGQAPEGYENIKVLPHIPYIQDNPFSKDQYLELRENVLDKLERMGLTDLRKNIVVEEMWTPHDIKDLYYSNRGAIYGVVSDKKTNRGFKAPKESEKYNNLFFVGGSVNPGGGMPMVVLSGQQVRDKIIKKFR